MTDKEVMQMALDALERVTKEMLACRDELAERGGRPTTNALHERLWDSAVDAYVDIAIPAAEALRTALAQGEQEPVAWKYETPAYVSLQWKQRDDWRDGRWTALYTAPPQRPWQGMTDEEVSEILDDVIGFNSCFGPETDFARAIEAKLKEKNHG